MQVYERVRAYIDARGLKQKAVAEASHISPVTFNSIMTGKRKMYAEDLRAICIALGESANAFIGGVDDSKAS